MAVYLKVSEDEETTIEHWDPITETDPDALIQVTNGCADDPETLEEDETINTSFSVGNTPGVPLPNAGGPGTRLFAIFGSMLMALAGAGMILMKRKKKYVTQQSDICNH